MRIFSDSRIRPTLYTVNVGLPEDGKSITQDRVIENLGLLGTKHIIEAAPGSDHGLQLALAPSEPEPDKTGDPPVYELRCCTLVMDEARTLLSKLGIHGSALGPTLCQLWGKDQAASPIKSGMMEINARMSLLGALACQDRAEFAELFAAETMGGLYSRVIVAPGPTGWKWSARWRPQVVFRRPPTRPIHVPDSVYNTVEAWRDAAPEGRICEIAYRVALISAAANHDAEITPECIQAALRFASGRSALSPSTAPPTHKTRTQKSPERCSTPSRRRGRRRSKTATKQAACTGRNSSAHTTGAVNSAPLTSPASSVPCSTTE